MSLLPGATRSAALHACPWLSYFAPLALHSDFLCNAPGYSSTPQLLNSSTPQLLNSSTPQLLNSSTPQLLNSSTPQLDLHKKSPVIARCGFAARCEARLCLARSFRKKIWGYAPGAAFGQKLRAPDLMRRATAPGKRAQWP